MNNDLFELVKKYGTDKSLSGYTNTYQSIFSPIKEKVTSVLEIGLGTLNPEIPSSFAGNANIFEHYKQGGSLRVWKDFFENAQVYGIDIAKDCMFEEDRIKTFLFDSSHKDYCDFYLKDLKFDIIIDDGNHDPQYQIKTLNNLFRRLKDGGFYVIEDLGGYSYNGNGNKPELLVDYLADFLSIVGENEYTNFGNHVVIRKKEKEKLHKTNLTVVTGLWDISRVQRPFDHYINRFEEFLKLECNLFVFIEKKYEYLVWKHRSKENTFVKVYELEDIQNMYLPYMEMTQKIRENEEWFNQTGENGWLKSSPQAQNYWYNPIVMSKMFLLHDVTIWNPFNTDYFVWLDAGITNTVPFGYVNECLKNVTQSLNPFLFLSYPYETETEIHGFKKADMDRYANADVKYVCRGGLFGGHKEAIHRANGEYYALLSNTLSEGLMGTEESIFTIMSYLDPHTYRRYELDGNGLIVKFAADKNPELIPIDKEKKIVTQSYLDSLKVSVYMLTFNFPHQVEHTIKKWLKHEKWLTKTRNILIDNSTTEEAREENRKLCEKYNFEHIVTNENLGINGGRFLAAQHFQESDSDYYIFIEDDMGIHPPESENKFCRNGFRLYVPNLYDRVLKILETSDVDFLKLSFTEVYMDNNLQVSWYNVPQTVRTEVWPDYDKLPVTGLDPNCPRTKFDKIEVVDGLAYITGEVYYANWPTICGKKGNQKMFLDTTWARPYEQTWMSYMFQETRKGNMKPAVLLASPIDHDRIAHYSAEERREN